MKSYTLIILLGIVFILLIFSPSLGLSIENFENLFQNKSLGSGGKYPQSEYEVLVQDSYPITHKYGVTDNTASKVWQLYPIFEVGSYAQMTNNIRYPKSVDTGNCMPVEFCGTLYEKEEENTNIVNPLPPVPIQQEGARVNYYYTPVNMLPYTSDMASVPSH
jgi:hypothetical protein